MWAWIVQSLISAGVGGAVAMWLLQNYTDKWLAHRFNEKLEWLRLQINSALDRAIKLHQREFEALPEAWALLGKAKGELEYYLSPLRQMADVARMSDVQLDEFLADSAFFPFQIESLKNKDGRERSDEYFKLIMMRMKARNVGRRY